MTGAARQEPEDESCFKARQTHALDYTRSVSCSRISSAPGTL
jgi:hypothetical protein